ncbi:MAG: ribonuclease III [Bdellovibrionales bacterium]|nr:ribonuclease III [Bdellovibrionales bacterium]
MTAGTLGALEQALGYKFRKADLITEALTHRSHHHEFGDSSHNERLEFLGDAVIDLCITETLMRLSPNTSEGDLSKMRSQLVSESSLARAARKLGLGLAVRLGRGEELSGGREREALLADVFEAVLAAVYLDAGLEEARRVILSCVDGVSSEGQLKSEITERLLRRDFKSRLQELCQSHALGAPSYRCVETRGPDHKKRFVMALVIQDREVLRSEGATKKEATQAAAQQLLDDARNGENLCPALEAKGVIFQKSPKRKSTPKATRPAPRREGKTV